MSRDDRDRAEGRRRREELNKQAREWAKFERENQPRDDEERRNVEAEDKHLKANWDAILRSAANMDDRTFDRWVSKGSNKRKIRKTGKSVGKLKSARKAKRSGWCAVLAVALLLIGATIVAGTGYGVVELAGWALR